MMALASWLQRHLGLEFSVKRAINGTGEGTTPAVRPRASVVTDEREAPPVGVVAECDVAEGVPDIIAPQGGMRALMLVRVFSEPVGMLDVQLPAEGMLAEDLALAIAGEFGPALQDRLTECGLAWDGKLPLSGLRPPRTPGFLASREAVLRDGPQMTLAVCTRGRPESLAVLLETLQAQEYRRTQILVVDNAPCDDRTRQVVLAAKRRPGPDLEYVVEPRPGLSWARNRVIEAADGEVIAWADDDERCDRWWAAELARGFGGPGGRGGHRDRRTGRVGDREPSTVRGLLRCAPGTRVQPRGILLRDDAPAEPAVPAAAVRGRRQHGLPAGCARADRPVRPRAGGRDGNPGR